MGGNDAFRSISEIRGNVLQMSFEPHGSCVVQRAMERAKSLADDTSGQVDFRMAILDELRGHVLELVGSRHGSLTLSEVMRQVPIAWISFVLEEIAGVEGEMARHPFGCRILESLIEHEDAPNNLFEKLLREASSLICNDYGIYILISILERCIPRYGHQIAQVIRRKTCQHAKAKKASKVVDKALVYCEDADKQAIAMDLFMIPEGFLQTAVCEGGSFVVKELLLSNVSCTDHRDGKATTIGELAKSTLLSPPDAMSRLRASKSGKRLLAELAQAGCVLETYMHP
jgi:hypothetical protein